jgi:hypothetical protein
MMITGGRPSTDFTREQIDAAKAALGQKVYPALAVLVLTRKLKLSRDVCYRLLDVARREVFDSLSELRAADPLTSQVIFLESVIANPKVKIRDKIAASSVMVRLLALDRIAQHLTGNEAVDEFLSRLAASRVTAEPSAN